MILLIDIWPKLYMSYKGFDIDIYFYQEKGDEIQSTEDSYFESERQWISKSLVFPLKETLFFGKKVKVPNEIERYLKTIYGYIGTKGKRDMKTGFWYEDETL